MRLRRGRGKKARRPPLKTPSQPPPQKKAKIGGNKATARTSEGVPPFLNDLLMFFLTRSCFFRLIRRYLFATSSASFLSFWGRHLSRTGSRSLAARGHLSRSRSLSLWGRWSRGATLESFATLHPSHDGVAQKNSGHNADLVGVRANRDTLAENAPSNEDFPDTTQATSEHNGFGLFARGKLGRPGRQQPGRRGDRSS